MFSFKMSKYKIFRSALNLSVGLQLFLAMVAIWLLWVPHAAIMSICGADAWPQHGGWGHWRVLVLLVWMVPIGILLIFDSLAFWRFRIDCQDNETIADELQTRVSSELWCDLVHTFTAGIYSATHPSEAFTFGFFQPRLYLGDRLLVELSRDQLQCVLYHEIEHARERDCFWGFLANLAHRVWWFLPKRKESLRRRSEQIEMLVDQRAIAMSGGCRDLYAETLMKVLTLNSAAGRRLNSRDLIARMSFGGHVAATSVAQLTERLQSIYDEREMRPDGRRLAGAITGVVLITILIGTSVTAMVPKNSFSSGGGLSFASDLSASLVCASTTREATREWWRAERSEDTRHSSSGVSQTKIPK